MKVQLFLTVGVTDTLEPSALSNLTLLIFNVGVPEAVLHTIVTRLIGERLMVLNNKVVK